MIELKISVIIKYLNTGRMEEEKKLPVKVSKVFNSDLDDIYQYSLDAFGIQQAELYENEIWKLVEGLSTN